MTSRDVVDEHPSSRLAGRAWTVGMLALGAVVLAAYSSFRKPLWIDEFLHFALGGLKFNEAWDVVTATATGINHGQTGIYMMLDWVLLQVFGASSAALRLPSLVAAAGLLLAGVWFLRLRGCSLAWQALGIVALAGQSTLMVHTGEARPYMPLAASTVGILAYYSVPMPDRRRWNVRILGLSSFMAGALMHPYFPLMLGLVATYSLGLALREAAIRRTPRDIVHFVNPALVLPAAAGYLTVGGLTWLRGSPSFDLDPYVSFGGSWAFVQDLVFRHFQFLLILPVALAVGVFAAYAVMRQVRDRKPLLPPLALMVVGLSSSLIVSLISVTRSYWVLPRQWVAGMALVAVGAVWLFSEIERALARDSEKSVRLPSIMFASATVGTMVLTTILLGQRLGTYVEVWTDLKPVAGSSVPDMIEKIDDRDGWVELANLNVRSGTSVWPELARFYEECPASEFLAGLIRDDVQRFSEPVAATNTCRNPRRPEG